MKKKGLWVLLAVIVFLFVDVLVLDAYLDKNVDKAEIQNVLETVCECETITGVSVQGLSLMDGVLGDKHEFTLTGCQLEDFERKMKSLHENFKTHISNFDEANLIELHFSDSNGNSKTVKIKKGELL